ncbi:MAG: pyridoxine 5'-phosphate synthase, partial [Verrucomicrobia bacterium]|nr:pyridoxine 5'-phosphate synthase [Verrucomicrobiota bacterium]
IDHAATLRQARYRGNHESIHAEPSPLTFAQEALVAGADGITIHLREDRRHIQEEDVYAIAKLPGVRLNLEMACTPAMVAFAHKLKPAAVCLVPESREEITTEGGLDVVKHFRRIEETVNSLKQVGCEVSLFIEANTKQIEAAHSTSAPVVELHLGLIVNAGHGINYDNIKKIITLPHLHELNIGHTIVARALLVGARQAVSEMKANLNQAR